MPSYSDAEMRAIMGRALQIDSGRSERFTPEQLRTIAAELGISSQALEVAMYEADSKGRGLMVDAPPRAGMPGWAKGLAVAVGAVLVIAASALVMRKAPSPAPVAEAARATPVGEAERATPAAPAPTKAFPARKTTSKTPPTKTVAPP
jgi:hypothetical protein